MIELVRRRVFDNQTSVATSEEIDNSYGDIFVIDIRGDSPYSVKVEGKQANSEEFKAISVIDASNMSTVASISSDGIYSAQSNGLKVLRVVISSLSGTISALCKIGISKEV